MKVLIGRVSEGLVHCEINCRIFCSCKKPIELPLLVSSLVHPNFTVTNFPINRDGGTCICLVDKTPFAADQVIL